MQQCCVRLQNYIFLLIIENNGDAAPGEKDEVTKLSTKVMPFFFKCRPGYSFFPYPPDGDNVQLHKDHGRSTQ